MFLVSSDSYRRVLSRYPCENDQSGSLAGLSLARFSSLADSVLASRSSLAEALRDLSETSPTQFRAYRRLFCSLLADRWASREALLKRPERVRPYAQTRHHCYGSILSDTGTDENSKRRETRCRVVCNGQPPFAHCTWFKKRTAGTEQRLFSAFLMHRND